MSTRGRFLSLCAILGLFTGCLDESGLKPQEPAEGGRYAVELFNEIHQQPVTRVNDEGFCDKDAVGIYVVNYANGAPGQLLLEGNQADNVKYELDAASGRWVPAHDVFYKDKTTPVDLIGYYPYSEPNAIDQCTFTVQKDQRKEKTEGKFGGYEASDFLWAKAEKVTPTASKVMMTYRHRMAGVAVSLVEGTGFAAGEFAQLTKDVVVTNVKRNALIDLSTGVVTVTGELPADGIVPAQRNGEFRGIVVPQKVGASMPLFKISVDGIPYIYRKSAEYEYLPGKLHKFAIKINKKTPAGVEFVVMGESITAWESEGFSHDGAVMEYVVIDCKEPGTLSQCITAAGKDAAKIKNLKVIGKVNSIDDFYFMREKMPMLQAINMKEVKIISPEDEIPSCSFSNKSSLIRFVFPDQLKRIGSEAFSDSNLSGTLILPEGVEKVDHSAFQGTNITGNLILPSSLKEIGPYAFAGCSQLNGKLELPGELTHIGCSAFNGTHLQGQLLLPETLVSIESDIFANCHFTGSLTIPPGITCISSYAFASNEFDGELKLPEGLLEVGTQAFSGCPFRYPIQFPKSLIKIGEAAFYGCQFSGQMVLPENLAVLGNHVFYGNNRMTGILKIPESLSTIGLSVFSGCSQLEGVVLPKSMESIGERAFADCFQLNSIVCKSVYPPMMASTSFNGVAKDNFAVEVPEQSVNTYITATGWNEFKRITAHRDFSVSRNLFRTLNAQNSKTVLIRALTGEKWSVESKPAWVTVTPSSGTGKMEVTVTINEMAHAQAQQVEYPTTDEYGNDIMGSMFGRRGEVVFLLDGKDYRSKMTVEQYDYEYGDGDVITNFMHKVGNGVNIVFMGDCFDARDVAQGNYLKGINEAIGYYFDIEPYKTYKDYFNVYTVVGLSPDSGVGSVNTIRESRFGTQYGLGGLLLDENLAFDAACKAPINNDVKRTLIVMIENTEDYGGICYLWGDGSAIALCPMSRDIYPYDYRGIVQHEAGGHGFGKLGDEYIYHNTFVSACPYCNDASIPFKKMKSYGFYENMSLSGNMHKVPWSHLIFDPKYSNTVDMFEGGYKHMRGVFRSEPNSCMNNNIPYYSAISREAMVKRIMDYAGETYSFEQFKQKDVMTAAPSPGTTKSILGTTLPTSHAEHRPPVFMGEHPEFNPNN